MAAPFATRSSTGPTVRGLGAGLGRRLRFHLAVLCAIPTRLVTSPRDLRSAFALTSDVTIGAGALVVAGGVVTVLSSTVLLAGTEVRVEGFADLEELGPGAFSGLLASWATTRELLPLLAGIALSVQVGAGFTAELGAMRISGEVDALEARGVPALVHLCATRVVATLATIVPLHVIALFSSLVAAEAVTTRASGLDPGVYGQYLDLLVPTLDVAYSLLKATIFAVVVALIHTYHGYTVGGGATGVGAAVGRATRSSIVSVVVIDLALSLVMWGGDAVRLAG